MAIVTAEVGVGHEGRFKVVRIFPSEKERGRKGVLQVAGRTQNRADHFLIRPGRPSLELLPPDPARAEFFDALADRGTVQDRDEHFGEVARRALDQLPAMGDPHLLAHGGQRRSFIIRKPHGQDRHMGQPADMDVLPAAIFRLLAACIFGEKIPVTLFQISIPVLSRGGHELEITAQIIRTVIAPARAQGVQ